LPGALAGAGYGAACGAATDAACAGGADVRETGRKKTDRNEEPEKRAETGRYLIYKNPGTNDSIEKKVVEATEQTPMGAYNLLTNNCCHWAKKVILAAGLPWNVPTGNFGFNPGLDPAWPENWQTSTGTSTGTGTDPNPGFPPSNGPAGGTGSGTGCGTATGTSTGTGISR
jgi:hypothetical protein